ncbi:MAG: flagellar export protein FliJ [Pseudomonadota bacterium]
MSSRQLDLVKGQAVQKQQALSERFKQVSSIAQKEREQLLQLQAYESDYLAKIKQEQHQWTAENTHRYRHFCHRLAQVISDQRCKVEAAEKQLSTLRVQLSEQRQRINALDDMIDRDERAFIYQQNKKEQKQSDELSGRLYY